MKGLDLLKKDWNKQGNFPNISEFEIYKMIHKKSSSIVKWIFVISVVEIAFWISLNVILSDDKQKEMMVEYHLDTFMNYFTFLHWGILVVFVYLFYKNFKSISAMSSAKSLMQSILRVRKIVQYYVWYNIIGTFIVMIIVWTFVFQYDKNFSILIQKAQSSDNETLFWTIFVLVLMLTALVMLGVLWLFYRVLYGILLKRLYKNYQELKKIEF